MLKRLTAIILLLSFGAGVASGAPLRSGKKECAMGGAMEMMDCCKHARAQGDTPDIQAARLCCALNCQNAGTTGPSSTTRIQSQQTVAAHSSAMPISSPPLIIARPSRFIFASHTYVASPPPYLLNLAFLI